MFTGYLWSGWWGCLRPQTELVAPLFYAKWTIVHKVFFFSGFVTHPPSVIVARKLYYSSSIDLSQGENAV